MKGETLQRLLGKEYMAQSVFNQIFLDKQETFIYIVIWGKNLILFVHNQITTIYV